MCIYIYTYMLGIAMNSTNTQHTQKLPAERTSLRACRRSASPTSAALTAILLLVLLLINDTTNNYD